MTRLRRVMVLATIALASVLVAAAPLAQSSESSGVPQARAWAVKVSGSSIPVLDVATSSAEAGAEPSATAAPVALSGQSPSRATATPEATDHVATPFEWGDPTGSGRVEGTYARAHVTGTSARSGSGLAAGAGTGFALADRLLSWEQQEQMMGTWNATNSAVAAAVNDALDGSSAVLEPLRLVPPRMKPMTGMGWIDVADVHAATSSAETSAAAGFSSARAEATLGELNLFGGFITVRNVHAIAVSQSVGGADDRSARTSIGGLRVAGIDFTAGPDGLRLDGNLLAGAEALAGVDDVLGQLAAAGIHIRTDVVTEGGDRRTGTAVQIGLSGPDQVLLVSIGHAEASAASVGGLEEGSGLPPARPAGQPRVLPEPPPPAPLARIDSGAPQPAAPPVSVASPTASPDAAAVATGPVHRTMPQSVVRAVRTGYLLLVAAGLAGAVLIPFVVGTRSIATAPARIDMQRRPS